MTDLFTPMDCNNSPMECVNTPLGCETNTIEGFTDMGFRGSQDGILGVTQSAHGFSLNTPVRYDAASDEWVITTASTESQGEVFGFVYEVVGVDSFKVMFRPYRTSQVAPAGSGNLIFVDDNGNLSRVPGTVRKPVGHVLKEGMILFPHMLGDVDGSGVGEMLGVTYETIARNMYAYPYTVSRDTDGFAETYTFTIQGGSIVKTITRDPVTKFATRHQITGDLPTSLTIFCKDFTRDSNGFIESVGYSDCT